MHRQLLMTGKLTIVKLYAVRRILSSGNVDFLCIKSEIDMKSKERGRKKELFTAKRNECF